MITRERACEDVATGHEGLSPADALHVRVELRGGEVGGHGYEELVIMLLLRAESSSRLSSKIEQYVAISKL